MAITVDDLPVAQVGWHDHPELVQITTDLLQTLEKHQVPAVGFVNENKLETQGKIDPRRVELLERWLDAGMELGNHGHSHLDLHRVPTDQWLADVSRGERVIRKLVESRGGALRYFRHPYLHTGRSVAVQRRTRRWLADRGYTVAPVTIDNGEWIYGSAYARPYTTRDTTTMRRLGTSYVDYMLDVVRFHEHQAQLIVGRPVAHVLLIHAYALNADHLGKLLDHLESAGWSFVTLDEALDDPAYQRPTGGYTGPGGITWLHRWAITAKMDRSVFAGEPRVPAWVRELHERRR